MPILTDPMVSKKLFEYIDERHYKLRGLRCKYSPEGEWDTTTLNLQITQNTEDIFPTSTIFKITWRIILEKGTVWNYSMSLSSFNCWVFRGIPRAGHQPLARLKQERGKASWKSWKRRQRCFLRSGGSSIDCSAPDRPAN